MKNEKLIEILQKEYDVDSRVKIHLHFGSGLAEKLVVVGTWNGDYGYSMDCTNYWKRGNLVTKYHSVQDLIDLLSEKNVSEMTNKDFTDIELEETVNGYLDLDKLVWDKPKPSKKLLDDEDFDFNDLYNTGEITDSDYEFVGPDSLYVELRNDRDSLHISQDGYKFIKGPRVKRWTKANQQQFQGEYIATVNKLAELHEKYELIIEEGLTENLPNVTEEVIREVRFKFDGVKAEVDSIYKDWHDEPLEIIITNEVGAKFITEISGIKDMIRLRNELIRRIDKLLCGSSEAVVDEAWEPETETNWDDDDTDLDPYGSTDSDDSNWEDALNEYLENQDEPDANDDDIEEEKPKAKKAVPKKKK